MKRTPIPIVAICALACAAGSSFASEPPDGIPVGPWVVAPVAESLWGYDSNPFFATKDGSRRSDRSARHALGAVATLPFRESRLSLAYRGEIVRFDRATLREDTIHDLAADLEVRFSTGDRAFFRSSYTRGLTDTLRFDPGGETVFRGDPYRFRVVEAGAERVVPGRRGYRFRATGQELDFPPGLETSFFEFRGIEVEAEYLEPLGASAWAIVAVRGRRFDHFCEDLDPAGSPCPVAGTPFREERGNQFLAGWTRVTARGSTYSARAGWFELRFPGSDLAAFEGVVGDAEARLRFGPNLWVEGSILRQVYPSFYADNNYFLYEGISVGAGISRTDRWESGCRVSWAVGRYETAASTGGGAPRRDETLRTEAYANLFLPRRFGVRLTLSGERRRSNDARLEFERRAVLVGVFFGWI